MAKKQASLVGGLVAQMAERVISIDDIVYLFDQIDNQILELHRCSSEDFLGLNARFKGFYKDAKGISACAGDLFLLFAEGANRRLIADLTDFHAGIGQSQAHLAELLESSLSTMAQMRARLSALYLPLRNMAQAVGTLSLLLTNLTLGHKPFLRVAQHTTESFNALRGEVDHFAERINGLGRTVRHYGGQLEQAQQQVQQVRGKARRSLDAVLNSVHYGLLLFAEKHAETNARVPDISQKTESTSKSIAGIITNLQYQDIIRQKMEHIQAAHQELMGRLRTEREHAEEGSAGWIDMLIQIRDISALQSAQLVATNREYQHAIETLSQNFQSIAHDMETIAELSRDTLRMEGEGSGTTAITGLLERLRGSLGELKALTQVVPEFHELQAELVTEGQTLCAEIEVCMGDFRCMIGQIEPLLTIPERAAPNESFTMITQQMGAVVDDLVTNADKVTTNVAGLGEGCTALMMCESDLKESLQLWKSFEEGVDRMHGIGTGLAQTAKRSAELLAQIEAMSKKVSHDTRIAMSEIRYYDLFEGVIGEIIDALNAISARIREEVRGEGAAGNLEKVRRHYTMASEHKIHDSFQGEGDVDLFGDEVIDEPEEDDDGLELF